MFGGLEGRAASIKTSGTYYNVQDHLKSSSLTTDATGAVTRSLDHTPFGVERVRNSTGSYDSRYTYTDQENDTETGLMYYKSRFYDPELKRFTSVDPWDGEYEAPQSLNKFSYVANNPLKYVDPTGEIYDLSQHLPNKAQLEIGRATQHLTSSNSTWNTAVSQPNAAGALVGIGGGFAAATAVPAVTAFSVSVQSVSGAGKMIVANRLFEGAFYSYAAGETLSSIPGQIEKFGAAANGDIKSAALFAVNLGVDAAPVGLRATPAAVVELADAVVSLGQRLYDTISDE